MSDTEIPEVQFNQSMALRVFPRPELKNAVLIPMPAIADSEMTVPTFIRPEWGGIQVFYGDYYGIINDGVVVYGSAKEQWEAMHSPIKHGFWVKTAVPTAYVAEKVCRIVTLIPDDSGNIKEASYTLEAGDWIVRQPGGEVQHVKAEKFAKLYYSIAEAITLRLVLLSDDQFAAWAKEQAGSLISV